MNPKLLTALLVLVVAGGIAYFVFRGGPTAEAGPAAPHPAGPPPVTVALVESRNIAETTEFTGRLGAIDDVEIRPRVSGYVEKVHFQSGQLVKRGDVLFTIDPRYYAATLAATEASVVQARVRLENSDKEAQRASQLLASRAISAEESESRTSTACSAMSFDFTKFDPA